MTDVHTDSPERLLELIRDIPVAMFTSADPTGALHGRPLTVQRLDDDGTVWFLVDADADWVKDHDPSINLAFVDSTTWVSIAGSAGLVLDRAVVDELRDAATDAWFDDDATPAALRVDPSRADYWDGPGRLMTLVSIGKGAVTGSKPDIGERGVVEP